MCHSPIHFPVPKPCQKDIKHVEDVFVAAVNRCKIVGRRVFDVFQWLIQTDLDIKSTFMALMVILDLPNWMRFLLCLAKRVREVSQTTLSQSERDGLGRRGDDGEWKQRGIGQNKLFAGELKSLGVDLVDTSSGGNRVQQKIPLKHGYQVPFAAGLKAAHPDLLVGAVGLLADSAETESRLKEGKSDVVLLAREFLRNRNPRWALTAARGVAVAVKPAVQHERAWTDMDMLALAGK